jgi:hypothetical protein
MSKDVILSVVRHVLTGAGALISSNGLATSGEVETGVGALVTLIGIAWAIYDKRKKG